MIQKRLYICFFPLIIFLVPLLSRAQVAVQFKMYPTSSFDLNDVWNQLITNYGAPQNVIFEGVIKAGPEEVARITTQSVLLNSGITTLLQTDVFIIDKWVKQDYAYHNLINFTNTLPYGNFEICFKVKDAATLIELTSQCSMAEISPTSPPLLISPLDNEEIYTNLPMFNWFPPAPILPDYNLIYDLKIVEVQNGQTPQDAIQFNNPVVLKQGITSTYYQYELSNLQLQYNKFYAWQVIAKNHVQIADGQSFYTDILSLSDVYVFILRQQPTANPDECYHVPAEQINTVPVAAHKKLKILFYNTDNSVGNLNYEITDASNAPVAVNQILTLERGSNKFIVDLENVSGFQNNAEYTLTINNNSKTYLLKFKYTN
jgi:hypothetical protein